MKWAFGIITDGSCPDRVQEAVASIRRQNHKENYELIIVGNDTNRFFSPNRYERFTKVHFDEKIKPGWITRKKNIIAQISCAENLCIMHDYVALNEGWLEGFEDYGDEWLACMTPIQNKDGSRFRDWCVIYNDAWMNPPIDDQQPPSAPPGRLLDYQVSTGHERWQYFSGAYFCVKSDVLLQVPLDEERVWGKGEDVQWSRLLYKQYGDGVFSLNQKSSVRFLKPKNIAPWELLAPIR